MKLRLKQYAITIQDSQYTTSTSACTSTNMKSVLKTGADYMSGQCLSFNSSINGPKSTASSK